MSFGSTRGGYEILCADEASKWVLRPQAGNCARGINCP